MTEETPHMKLAAARVIRDAMKKIADDEAQDEVVRASAACVEMFILDVLPLYERDAARERNEITRFFLKHARDRVRAYENEKLAAFERNDPYHI